MNFENGIVPSNVLLHSTSWQDCVLGAPYCHLYRRSRLHLCGVRLCPSLSVMPYCRSCPTNDRYQFKIEEQLCAVCAKVTSLHKQWQESQARATDACSQRRRGRKAARAARMRASWAPCPASSAPCRPWRPSRSCQVLPSTDPSSLKMPLNQADTAMCRFLGAPALFVQFSNRTLCVDETVCCLMC